MEIADASGASSAYEAPACTIFVTKALTCYKCGIGAGMPALSYTQRPKSKCKFRNPQKPMSARYGLVVLKLARNNDLSCILLAFRCKREWRFRFYSGSGTAILAQAPFMHETPRDTCHAPGNSYTRSGQRIATSGNNLRPRA